jgi:ketosteroid isomerase-like protein
MHRSLSVFAAILITTGMSFPRSALADGQGDGSSSVCPAHLHDRTALQVWEAHLAAIQSGNPALIACDYADDATVIMTGQVISGKANVLTGLESFAGQLGGVIPTVDAVTNSGQVVLVNYHLNTTHLIIPDGADTYVIRDGLIRYQTVNATFELQ